MESAGIGLVGGGNNGAGQKNPASAQCEMGRGNAPYPSSASADQFHDQSILFQDSLPPSLAQDTPPPSVEDYQNRSLDMPHLNDDDMTDIFQLHDQLQQQQQDQQQQQQVQQLGEQELSIPVKQSWQYTYPCRCGRHY